MATAITFMPHRLPDRAIISLSGEGVFPFLHNILTCNVERLEEGHAAYGALLSPQGKILHDIFVHRRGGDALIDCDASGCDDLIHKLKLYRLRAKFDISLREDLDVVSGEGAVDPRHVGMGLRGLSSAREFAIGEGYHVQRFVLGIADSAEIGVGKLFPHEANFDRFGGVDFKKGCYIGQEVVSRMQHRATARNRILPITFDDPQLGADRSVLLDNVLIGEVLGRHKNLGLALIRLDRLAEAKAAPAVGGIRIHISKPEWLAVEAEIPVVAQ